MTRRIAILTGSDLRHEFVRRAFGLATDLEVVLSLCETTQGRLDKVIEKDGAGNATEGGDLQRDHLAKREQSERDFFGAFCRLTPDHSRPRFIDKGEINSPAIVAAIAEAKPDILLSYGCSIVKEPLLSLFKDRFINVHLGLSPYYRGSGTNFWPLVNGEPEFVGATFMHIDAGVDTGAIIHQVRAEVCPGDGPHEIGNRLIAEMTRHYIALVRAFSDLGKPTQPPQPAKERYYKMKDFTPQSVVELYQRFDDGLVALYLREKEARAAQAPIVANRAVMDRLTRESIPR